jgi:hypothetical protein
MVPTCLRRGVFTNLEYLILKHLVRADAKQLAPMYASPYSITSSARASSAGGTVRPRTCAALRLMIISKVVG